MGLCASSRRRQVRSSREVRRQSREISNIIRRPSVATVIHVDGRVEEFKISIKAKNIIKSQNHPGHFLCSSESMSIGKCMPHVSDDDDLELGQIYFVMPLSEAEKPLSLQDLCSLAIKASSGVSKERVDFYSRNSKLASP